MKGKSKRGHGSLSIVLAACLAVMSPLSVFAGQLPEEQNKIKINEIESNDANGGNDWVEIINLGTEDVDISGFYITDDKGAQRVTANETYPLAEGTVLKAGQVLVLEDTVNFDFGLGKADTASLHDASGNIVDTYSWTAHAAGTYSRTESGEFVDQEPTKGAVNTTVTPDTPNPGNPQEPDTPASGSLVINEVNSSPDDWVEVMNTGSEALDISEWELRDNSDDHRWRFPAGTTVQPGALLLVKSDSKGLIFDDATDTYIEGIFDQAIGISSGDEIRLYNREGQLADSHNWTEHANVGGDESASWGRYPDGTGSFVLMPETPNAKNSWYAPNVVINEVQSNDPNGKADWIELANPTSEPLSIAGLVLKDNDDTNSYTIPSDTVIPADGFLVLTADEFGFGLGKGDSVRIFENDMLIGSTTWSDHTNPTWGLYPDVNGKEYRNTLRETPGAANEFAGMPKVIAWPGSDEVVTSELTFLKDSSGLDFAGGRLYAVDNGTGKFWIMDVAKDGTLSFAKGFEDGKLVNFTTPSAKGPDTEGITVDGNGYVYLASERDNSDKGVNYNVILKADPNAPGSSQNAMQQWDLTKHLPDVLANTGIEAVEWVPNSEISGLIFDMNTNAPFDPSVYPNATAGGVFFVALEDNGHVYAFVLNGDGTAVLISDIDSKIGGAMALDYDSYGNKMWIAADDGYGNILAQAVFNGTNEPEITHVAPAKGVDITRNNEGFAIASPEYTVNGQRPVYRFADGDTSGALTIGSINCSYTGGSTNTQFGTNTGGQNGNGTNGSNPQTGDSSDIILWMILLLAGCGGLAGSVVYKKKKNK